MQIWRVEKVDDGDPRIWISVPLLDFVVVAGLLLAIGKWAL